jgi:hypothetical protein
MKALADDMSSTSKKIDEDDLVGYILVDLDSDFDYVISVVSARAEPISLPELYGQLIYHEQRQELCGKEFFIANAASRGHGGPPTRGNFGRGRGHGYDRNNGSNEYSHLHRVEWQLCGKKGHTVLKCLKQFDQNYTGEEKSVATASKSYDVDTSWYVDSGATDHITGDLEKLTTRDKYLGNDQVHTASGLGMRIDQVGHSVIHTTSCDLSLNNMLLCSCV